MFIRRIIALPQFTSSLHVFHQIFPYFAILSKNLQSMDHFSARNLQSKHLRVPCCCVCWTSCDAVCVVGRIQSGNGLLGRDVGVSERWVLIPQPDFFFHPKPQQAFFLDVRVYNFVRSPVLEPLSARGVNKMTRIQDKSGTLRVWICNKVDRNVH